jgi:hypothetical protein
MESPNPPELRPWQKALAISDGDFEGLMESARISIGLILMRNEIVHVIATEEGRQQAHIVNDPPHREDAGDHDYEITDEMLQEATDTINATYRARISIPIHWYKLLIEASNHVFIVENTLRRTSRTPPRP